MLYDEHEEGQAREDYQVVPDQLKWNATLIEEVRPTPYDDNAGHDQEVAFQDRPSKPGDGDEARKAIKSRRMYLKGEGFKPFGYTVGCPRCDHARRYCPGHTTKGHSIACRQRITDELMQTPEGLRRFQNEIERLNRDFAEHVEANAQDPTAMGGGCWYSGHTRWGPG